MWPRRHQCVAARACRMEVGAPCHDPQIQYPAVIKIFQGSYLVKWRGDSLGSGSASQSNPTPIRMGGGLLRGRASQEAGTHLKMD